MRSLMRLTLIGVFLTISTGCSWLPRKSPPPPSRVCDLTPDVALESGYTSELDDTIPIGQALLNMIYERNQCKIKHEVLKGCIEADRPKVK